jgi:hypothetical protein
MEGGRREGDQGKLKGIICMCEDTIMKATRNYQIRGYREGVKKE